MRRVVILLALLLGFFFVRLEAARAAGAPALIPASAAPDAWSDYQAAHAKWESDVAALAAWEAAEAKYQADLATWQFESAAYDAARAALAAYEADVAAAEDAVRAALVASFPAQQTIILTESWPGPWGFASDLAAWMGGGSTAPPQLAFGFLAVKDELATHGLSTTEWDALGSAINKLDRLRRSAPTALPSPPGPAPTDPGPRPPDPGPEPQPPTTKPADYLLDPTGYVTVATGARKASSNPILDVWKVMKAGEVAEMSPGGYHRADLKAVSTRPAGGAPVTFRGTLGPAGQRATILRDPLVGSSDALALLQNVSDTAWLSLDIEADDRAGIKLVDSKNPDGTWSGTGLNHTFRDVRVLGGWNPTDPAGAPTKTKWGVHAYMGGAMLFEDCVFDGIFEEHCGYEHNSIGDWTFRRCKFSHCGRTAWQWVSRPGEGPSGIGTITFEDCEIVDTCLQDQGGGSAITDRGGNPTTDITLLRVKVRLGCDPNLQAPWNQNITGAVVVDTGSPSYPGGTRSLTIDSCDFEVGTVWPGVSGARRVNVSVDDCATLTIKDSRIVQGPKAFPIAIEIKAGVGAVHFLGTNVVVGQVKYRGVTYPNFDAFRAANPTLFSRLAPVRRLLPEIFEPEELRLAA